MREIPGDFSFILLTLSLLDFASLLCCNFISNVQQQVGPLDYCHCGETAKCSYSPGWCIAFPGAECPSAAPKPEFECVGGSWVLHGNLSVPSIDITSHVTVEGGFLEVAN